MIQTIDYKLVIFEKTFDSATHPEGAVVGKVPGWNVENERDVEVSTMVSHNFLGRFPERNSIVVHVAQMPDQQSFDIRQFPAAAQIQHHSVDVVQIFVQIFDEQYLFGSVNVRRGTDEGVEHGEITSC